MLFIFSGKTCNRKACQVAVLGSPFFFKFSYTFPRKLWGIGDLVTSKHRPSAPGKVVLITGCTSGNQRRCFGCLGFVGPTPSTRIPVTKGLVLDSLLNMYCHPANRVLRHWPCLRQNLGTQRWPGDRSVQGVRGVRDMDFGELLWDYFILDFWFVLFSILNISLISLTHILPKDVKVVLFCQNSKWWSWKVRNFHKFTEWSSSVSSSHLEGLGEICCLWLWLDGFLFGGRSYTMLHVRQVW